MSNCKRSTFSRKKKKKKIVKEVFVTERSKKKYPLIKIKKALGVDRVFHEYPHLLKSLSKIFYFMNFLTFGKSFDNSN